MPSASSTPWDDEDDSALNPAEILVRDWEREQYWLMHESHAVLDNRFFNSYDRDSCPRCGSERIIRYGTDRTGLRRWHCNECTRTFTPTTATIFEDHKLPVCAWAELLLGVMSFESLEGIIRRDRRSPTTPPYQLEKVFMVLEGIQDDVVLSGRVQIDEMYYSVPDAEAEMGAHGKKPGFSRNQTCIAIATEEPEGLRGSGRSVFRVLGRGKPSGQRAMNAYGSHIEPGSTLVHDMEKAHGILVRELKLGSEAHNSKVLKSLPDDQNPLWKVNRLCFLLRLFLDSHSGFDRRNFDGWLDLFSVMMNPPDDRLEKAAMVLDRAMASPKTLRYRKFYKQKPSSQGWNIKN